MKVNSRYERKQNWKLKFFEYLLFLINIYSISLHNAWFRALHLSCLGATETATDHVLDVEAEAQRGGVTGIQQRLQLQQFVVNLLLRVLLFPLECFELQQRC